MYGFVKGEGDQGERGRGRGRGRGRERGREGGREGGRERGRERERKRGEGGMENNYVCENKCCDILIILHTV